MLVLDATFHPGPVDLAAAAALVVLTLLLAFGRLWSLVGTAFSRRARDREAVRQLGVELDGMLAQVGRALALPEKLNLDSAEAATPVGPTAAARLLEERLPALNMPVERSFDRYRTKLPRRAQQIERLTELRRADEAFCSAAQRLDRRLIEVTAEYNARLRIPPFVDRMEQTYFMGRVLGVRDEELQRQLGLPAEIAAGIRQRAMSFAADPELAGLVQPYQLARAQFVAAAESLRRTL